MQLYSTAVGSACPHCRVQALLYFLRLPRHSRALFFIHQPAFDTESGNYFAAKSVQGRWETICRLLLEQTQRTILSSSKTIRLVLLSLIFFLSFTAL